MLNNYWRHTRHMISSLAPYRSALNTVPGSDADLALADAGTGDRARPPLTELNSAPTPQHRPSIPISIGTLGQSSPRFRLNTQWSQVRVCQQSFHLRPEQNPLELLQLGARAGGAGGGPNAAIISNTLPPFILGIFVIITRSSLLAFSFRGDDIIIAIVALCPCFCFVFCLLSARCA